MKNQKELVLNLRIRRNARTDINELAHKVPSGVLHRGSVTGPFRSFQIITGENKSL